MSSPRDSLRARILAVLLQTKRAEVPWRVLLRNTTAVIVPLAAGIAAGQVGIGLWISVGALTTMYSDQPGPYRQRLARLLSVSGAAGSAAFIGMVLGGQLAALLAATLLIAFAGALLVVFGDAAGRVGMTAMILLVITAASPAGSVWTAFASAALITCGGLLLTLFSIAAWPLQRHGPEREALAALYHGLAAVARERKVDTSTAPALSDGMTALQHALHGPHRARGPVADSFGVLLELAERIRLELTALADSDPGERLGCLVRGPAAALLDGIGRVIAAGTDTTDTDRTLAGSLQELRAAETSLPPAGVPGLPQARHFHALRGQLAAAARNAGRASAAGARRAEEEELQLPRAVRPQSALPIVVASLTPRSAAFRHAVRTAACVTIALWIGRLLDVSHGYWIPMTVAIVLRADYGATFSFGLLRVAGTIMGLLLITGLLHVLPSGPWPQLAVMAALCMAYRYFGTVHYGIAVTALTGLVVLLLALAGEPPEPTMISRLIATVIGSVMALTAFGLWPTREREQIRPALTRLLEAYASYVGSMRSSARREERRQERQAVRVARANAEAALARLLAEPNTPAALAELAQSLLANGNRLARTAMTLDAALSDAAARPAPHALDSLMDLSAVSLRQIAASIGSTAAAPSSGLRGLQREFARSLGADGSGLGAELMALTDRLVDNINTLAHVLDRAQAVRARVAAPEAVRAD